MNGGFDKYFRINLKMLSYAGIKIDLNENKVKEKRFVERFPVFFFMNAIGIADGIFQILWIADIWSYDNELIVKISTNALSNVTCICKGLQMATNVDKMRMLISEMVMLWKGNFPHKQYRYKILNYGNKMLLFCKIYILMAMFFVILFGLPPIQNFLFQYFNREVKNYTYDFSQRVFLVRYPFPVNSISIYFLILLEEECLLLASMVYWLCCDLLFIQLTTQVSLQLEILKCDINYIVHLESNDIYLKECFINFIKRYHDLLRLCEMIEKIFSPVIFTVMLLSSMNMCFNLFELREMFSKENYVTASLHIFFLLAVLNQICVYCVYADILTQQVGSIANAVYACEWTQKSYKLWTYLQLLIIRSQIPFYFTALKFFPINITRLTWIFKTAASYYMMLQTTS